MRISEALLFVLVNATACHVQRHSDNTEKDAVARGASTYVKNCAMCHGGEGYEVRAPDLRFTSLLSRDIKGNIVGPVVRAGRPTLGMPAFSGLTSSQMTDLAAYLHSASDVFRARAAAGNRTLPGDVAQGKAYFAATCSGCHSPAGDLAGIGAKYTPVVLQRRILYPENAATTSATVTMSGGRTIQGRLVHNDEFDISLIDKDGWYRSFSRTGVKVEIHDPLAAHGSLLEKYTNPDIQNLVAYLVTLR